MHSRALQSRPRPAADSASPHAGQRAWRMLDRLARQCAGNGLRSGFSDASRRVRPSWRPGPASGRSAVLPQVRQAQSRAARSRGRASPTTCRSVSPQHLRAASSVCSISSAAPSPRRGAAANSARLRHRDRLSIRRSRGRATPQGRSGNCLGRQRIRHVTRSFAIRTAYCVAQISSRVQTRPRPCVQRRGRQSIPSSEGLQEYPLW